MRTAPRIDSTHADIVAALRRCGCTVQSLASVGNGCPDLLVGRAGVNYALEVKSPDGSLNEVQSAWHVAWNGHCAVVSDAQQALGAVGLASRPGVSPDVSAR